MQTDATLLAKLYTPKIVIINCVMLHVAPVCTACCMSCCELLGVVACIYKHVA